MALCVAVSAPSTSAAQIVGGQAVEASSGAPLVGIPVFLLRTDDPRRTVVGESTSDRRGFFQLGAGKEGRYRLLFGDTARPISVGPEVIVSADSVVLRQYAVPLAAHAFLETEVELAALPLPTRKGPAYPTALREQGIQGEVHVSFVVDTTGRVDLASVKVQCASEPDFEATVREYLPQVRFVAAKWRGFTVRQLKEQPFTFSMVNGPAPRRPPRTRCPPAPAGNASPPT